MLTGELKERRTQYALGRNLAIFNEEIDGLVRTSIRLSPTAFNCQGSRALVLFGEQSGKLWEITKDALAQVVRPDDFGDTEKRIDGFSAGVGTVPFCEDQQVMRSFQGKFPTYADQFPVWADQSNGMAQLAVWTALAEADVGASLQYYNPLIDAPVATQWSLPETWKLRAQMPFGSHEAPFPDKQFIPDDVRFCTVGLGH